MERLHKLCHCALTGYVEVLVNGECCEICEDGGEECNLENIQAAFKWYQGELGIHMSDEKNGKSTG